VGFSSFEIKGTTMHNIYNTLSDNPFTRYAKQLARVVDPVLINRLQSAGLNRASRRSLTAQYRNGTLRGHHFPQWLIAKLMNAGDGAFA
jgi:hypothetical protein